MRSNKLKVNLSKIYILLTLVLAGYSPIYADITYTFHLDGVDATIRSQIEVAVTEAVSLYNQQGSFNHALNINYNSGVPTAQASSNGTIDFGGSRNTRTALHEMLHTLGVGQYWNWSTTLSNGVWTGAYGNAQLSAFDGAGSQVYGDSMHFWPYGLNYDSEDGSPARYRSVRVVAALRADMGVLSIIQEPVYQIVSAGSTATFSVTVVGSSSYAWYKQGNSSPLTNGGNISGATTNTLQITNAQTANEGRYYCVCGALTSRPATLTIAKTTPQLVGHWQFDGNLNDSVGPNHAMITGTATYAAGQAGQSIALDAVDDHVTLPAGIANYNDITLAAWVYWNGGSQWQRIFDFGTGTNQYLFLSPNSGGGTLRFAIKNGGNEQIVETPAQMAAAQWVHVAVTLGGDTAKLYVNGILKATNTAVTINPSDFNPVFNYIGDSQWPADPLFNGRIDDFRIYNFALTGTQVTALASGNTAPVFTSDPINNLGAVELSPYSGTSLTSYANDVDGMNTITFSKVSGPDWLAVASNGMLSGVPGNTNVGVNVFTVRVTDVGGLSDTAQMNIQVANIYSGIAGLDDLRGLAAQWLTSGCTDTPACNGADLNGDQDVDLADFSELAIHWLADETLQLHLKLDETSGTTAQNGSIYNRPGILTNGPTWSTEGKSGGALSFDGTDDYVEIPSYQGVTGTASRTCCAWIKTIAVGQGNILSWGADQIGQKWLFRTEPSGVLSVGVWGGYISTTAPINNGQWHHVAAVLTDDGSPSVNEILLYIDGVLQSTSASNSQSVGTVALQNVILGAFKNAGVPGAYFNGLIDDVRIYSRALTASEITSLAQ